ncbi:MAG TPA: type II toxin-antitoxin system RelE/ParE family toxin [Agitococcus sp.]|jgi:phage-related protein|nr:type II toxin-antitoxin system RelE/ParE family toxin [Agitococcus sp.]
MKPVVFVGSSLNDLRDFAPLARQMAGFQIDRVQNGLMPEDFKPMPNVGQGVYEIRVNVQGAWRVLYISRLEDAIYVLHCFQKKTLKTRKEDIDLAQKRYKEIGG